MARDFDLAVLHTSAPSFASDLKTIDAMKSVNPSLKAGLIGAKVAVDPSGSLSASKAIDFVAGNEFDFTIKEVAEGRRFGDIDGLSYRDANGRIWYRLERGTRLGLQPATDGKTTISHFTIKVAPFDRQALDARLRELRAEVLPSPDEPDVVRFRDNNGITVEVRVAE